MRYGWLFTLALAGSSMAALVSPATSGQLISSSTSEDGVHITVSWTFREYDGLPVAYPEWVGYDLYRRPVNPCLPFERVNPDPFPRTVAATHSHQWIDTPPTSSLTYEYKVVTIDASREPVSLTYHPWGCEFCAYSSWASAPNGSAPLTVGRLLDEGWTSRVAPCDGSCSPAPYLEGGEHSEALQAYAGTQTIVHLYGGIYCGGIEGCGMIVERYELAPCDRVVSAQSTAWGRLKLIYR